MVNNCAAAVLLVLTALAAGREVIVSRGELVEIGGGFRIPDVMRQSGATPGRGGHHQPDAARATTSAALDRAHRAAASRCTARTSPWSGFTEEASRRRARRAGARPRRSRCFDDLGSGASSTSRALGLRASRTVRDAVASGADLVAFSGDKLLGGPQAGIIVGRKRRLEARPASTPCTGRCASTSSRWPRSKRRCSSIATAARARSRRAVLLGEPAPSSTRAPIGSRALHDAPWTARARGDRGKGGRRGACPRPSFPRARWPASIPGVPIRLAERLRRGARRWSPGSRRARCCSTSAPSPRPTSSACRGGASALEEREPAAAEPPRRRLSRAESAGDHACLIRACSSSTGSTSRST